MTELFSERTARRFEQLRDEGLTDREAIDLIAQETGRTRGNIRTMLKRKFRLSEEGLFSSLGNANHRSSLIGLGIIAAGYVGFSYLGANRPDTSELTAQQFEENCASAEGFEEFCQGKFVIWEGVLEDSALFLDDGAFRIDMGGRAIDLYDAKLPEGERFDGMRVQFSGFLTKNNSVYDDVTDGEIISVLNNPEEVREARIASGDLPSEAWCAAERGKVHVRQTIEAECRRMTTDGVWGQGFRESACEAERTSRLRECGIEIYDGNAPNAPAL